MGIILLELQAERDVYAKLLAQLRAVEENYKPEYLLGVRIKDAINAVEGKIYNVENDIAAWTKVLNKQEKLDD